MDNAKTILRQLCDVATLALYNMDMPVAFSKTGLPIDPYRKSNIDLSTFVLQYFDTKAYSMEVKNKLEVFLHQVNSYGQKITISILFYEPCWRIEYEYHIAYQHISERVFYFCHFSEDKVDMDGAFRNMIVATDYIKRAVDDEFNALLKR